MLKNSLLEEQDIEMLRRGDGYYNADGDWVPASEISSTIKAIVQPYQKGSDQFILPEGVKSEDTLVVYTKTQLRNINDYYKYNADTIIIDNLRYQIQQVADYSKYKSIVNLHYQCLAVRETKSE